MIDRDRETILLLIPPWPEMIGSSYRFFLPNEKHITRICEHYVLIFMLERTLFFTEDRREIALNKGEWYIQRPGLLQQGTSGSPAPTYFYIHFLAQEADFDNLSDQSLYSNANGSYVQVPRRGIFDHRYLRPFFDQLDYCYKTKPFDILGMQSIFLTILNSIAAWPQATAGGLGKEISRYLSENYSKDLTCDTLAEEFHFSTEYINRKVKQYTGMTPVQYLQKIRITRAMDLLANTDHTLSYIASEVGYHDSTVFYKAFHKLSGMSPGEWRKKSRRML
jgi:AraC-like DNA-binding protein